MKSRASAGHESIGRIVAHVILTGRSVRGEINWLPGDWFDTICVNGNIEAAHVPYHVPSRRVEPRAPHPRAEIILGQQWNPPRVRSQAGIRYSAKPPGDRVVSWAAVQCTRFKRKRERHRDLDHRPHCVSFAFEADALYRRT